MKLLSRETHTHSSEDEICWPEADNVAFSGRDVTHKEKKDPPLYVAVCATL